MRKIIFGTDASGNLMEGIAWNGKAGIPQHNGDRLGIHSKPQFSGEKEERNEGVWGEGRGGI